jgi:hypothetical protein
MLWTGARQRLVLAAVTSISVVGCVTGAVGSGTTANVDLTDPGDADVVRFVHLGSGGWIIERGDDQVLAAPLFSNPSLLRTGLRSIRSDTALVDRYMSRYDVTGATEILVGHAHYDHLMDVPRVARSHAPNARIVGNTTVKNTLGTWSGVGDRVDVVNEIAGDQHTVGEWLRYGDGVPIMGLRSKHAAHFDGYTLYRGTRDRPLTSEPRWVTEWLEGRSHAYLVDFLDPDGSVAFRVSYQDAVSPAPAGFAPEALIEQHPVDVAIFVPATFDQVDWHPEAFVENLRPEHVLLGHWEDFFVPIDAPTTSVLLTDLGHFERRLAALRATYGDDPAAADDPAYIHSDAHDLRQKGELALYDEYQNDLIGPGGWPNINVEHYRNVNLTIRRHRGERILVTFGGGHKYWLLERLRERADVELLDLRRFLPG